MSSTHTITFSQISGRFTVDKDLIGKQDPYIIFQSGHAKVQTKALKSAGQTAEWRESYSLEKFSPSSGTVLEVTVYNHNTLLPDAVIGSGTIDLSSLNSSSLGGSGGSQTVRLTDKKNTHVGELSFQIHGGGYSGSGTGTGVGTGTGTGHHTGTGVGTGTGHHTGTGVGTGTGHHTGSGVGGVGSGTHGHSGTGAVVGAGAGTTQGTAQHASDKAAAQGRSVSVNDGGQVGVGHPVSQGTHGHHTGTGVGSGTGLTGQHGHHEHGHHHGTGAGVTGTRGVGTEGISHGTREGEVIDRKYYTGVESRPQDQALVEQYREHNPYAKDYETTVQHTGRERLVGSQIEALGTKERVVGQDHHIHANPASEISRNLPSGAINERPGGEGWVQGKPGPVCDTNTFSITGDRTVDKERVTDLREHRDFEKEFEVKTQLVGERNLNRGTDSEILNRERVLVDEKDKNACAGHPDVGPNATGPNTRGTTTSIGSGTGHTGAHVPGTGHGSHTGSHIPGTGHGSHTGSHIPGTGHTGTGTGHTGTGTGLTGTHGNTGQRSTVGEKAAGFIPGTEESRDKKAGGAPGSGAGTNTAGRPTTGEKAAGFIPGSEENREKKAERQAY